MEPDQGQRPWKFYDPVPRNVFSPGLLHLRLVGQASLSQFHPGSGYSTPGIFYSSARVFLPGSTSALMRGQASLKTPSPAVLSDLPSRSFSLREGRWKPVSGSLSCPAQAFAGRHMQPKSGAASKDNLLVLGQLLRGRSPGRRVAGPIQGQLFLPCPFLDRSSSAVVRGFVLREDRCGTVIGAGSQEFFSRACTWEASGSPNWAVAPSAAV